MSIRNGELVRALSTFKQGLGGDNERDTMIPWLSRRLRSDGHNQPLRLLDIGSADGERLAKTIEAFRKLGFELDVVAVEPCANDALRRVVEGYGRVDWIRAEQIGYKAAFDVAIATQVDYYYSQPTAVYERLAEALRSGSFLAVTLVSETCVLNRITRYMLDGTDVLPVTAELCEVRKGGAVLFEICEVIVTKAHLDLDHFLSSPDHLQALAIVLSRNLLNSAALKTKLASLPSFLKRECSDAERINHTLIARRRG